MNFRSGLLCAGAFLLMSATPAVAQSDSDGAGTTIQITPYVWASGFGGTLGPGPGAPTVHVDKSFGELMEDVDAAFFVSSYQGWP